MKKEYVDLSIEISKPFASDVICTSSPFDGEDQFFNKQNKFMIF